MTKTTAFRVVCLGLMVTLSSLADARPCRRPGWDQGYGCYFAAPYVGTGRYCAGYGYGPCGNGSFSYYGPAPVGASMPAPAVSAPSMAPTPAAAPARAPTPPAAPLPSSAPPATTPPSN